MAHQDSDLIGRVSELAGGVVGNRDPGQVFAHVQGLIVELERYHRALADLYSASNRPSVMHQGQALAAELQQEIHRVSLQIGDALLALAQAGGRLVLAPEPTAARPTLVADARGVRHPPRTPSLSHEEQCALVKELVDRLGPPKQALEENELFDEILAMDELTRPGSLERWGQVSPGVQRTFLAMIVARARGLKGRVPLPPLAWKQLNEVLSRLPAFSKAHNPGYINGLKLAHQPERANWIEDALGHFKILQRELEPKRSFESLRAVPPPRVETAPSLDAAGVPEQP